MSEQLDKQFQFEGNLICILGSLAKKDESVTVSELAQRAMDKIQALEAERGRLLKSMERLIEKWRDAVPPACTCPKDGAYFHKGDCPLYHWKMQDDALRT